ncbi:MAG: EF-hand domain-containing protein [Betaproteobacteria bacterium]|nr:EF-hand domain-containing protein [Betaproteobacteria bacterium]MBV9360392.1 EF-hand domain-containing protein [Betaproteobacteria bacterium]
MRTLFLILAFTSQAWAQTEAPKGAPQPVARVPSAAAGATAVPREDPAAAQDLFRQLDRNGDGVLTADELWTPRGEDANWAAIDRNRDGRITPEEFTVLRR